ncbi:hypothetical protein [Candidatus Magnetominusculus xianensis]|uniref:Lipoprotein n=1 Tax=Candidatus Magnetominusculus xianensis TaxID=1748249 RepID=A0ABR5SJP3_9BACT|nr:hypothetical protein [Candidatus Magnetominusculus xianensis]KWT94959.1 putative lipoprotein [Candidatus Magnetominusculus xianensis]MBF0405205.1 hypothetical protein [Nitrospirota bacterium]
MLKNIIAAAALLSIIYLPAALYAQGYADAIGGVFDDVAFTATATPDNGTVLGGYTRSYGAGDRDSFIVKLDEAGLPIWKYTYGGTGDEDVQSIKATADGGLIVAGYTTTFGAGQYDMWIMKLTSEGAIQWQKTYGGLLTEYAKSIEQTADGGYIVAGYTGSFGDGAHDIWALRLRADGSILWQKTFGSTGLENTYAVRQTPDGGLIVAGQANNFNLDPTSGSQNILLLKLDVSGTIQWQNAYGGPGIQTIYTIENTPEGGYIFAAYSESFGKGDQDVWIVKTDASGSILWQKTYGGPGDDRAFSISRTQDGGYVAAGDTNSFGAGGLDLWVFKIDGQGNILWQKTFGGGLEDSAHAYSSVIRADGSIVIAGQTKSFGEGGYDMWVIQLSKDGMHPASYRPYILGIDTNALVRDTFTAKVKTSMNSRDTFVTPADTQVQPTCAPAVFTRQCP